MAKSTDREAKAAAVAKAPKTIAATIVAATAAGRYTTKAFTRTVTTPHARVLRLFCPSVVSSPDGGRGGECEGSSSCALVALPSMSNLSSRLCINLARPWVTTVTQRRYKWGGISAIPSNVNVNARPSTCGTFRTATTPDRQVAPSDSICHEAQVARARPVHGCETSRSAAPARTRTAAVHTAG